MNTYRLGSILTLIIIFVSTTLSAEAGSSVVVDSLTRIPLPKASIYDRNGNFIGVSNDIGQLPKVERQAYPLTISYMGYSPAVASFPDVDTLFLRETGFELPEIVVEAKKSEVLRLVAYVREYSSISTYTDTVLLFREKMVDFMVALGKNKRLKSRLRPRVLASRSYYHFSDCRGLDSVSNHFGGYFSWSDWIGIRDYAPLPPAIADVEAAVDTTFGKYGPSAAWRRNGKNIWLDLDVLADTLNRAWTPELASFLESGLDLRRLNMRWTFTDVDADYVYASNVARVAFDIESKGRGSNLTRFFRTSEPIYVDTHAEIYITDREYISSAQARRCEKNPLDDGAITIMAPSDAPELQPAVKMIVERVENIDYAALRLNRQLDKRYAGIKDYGKIEKGGFLKYLKSIFF